MAADTDLALMAVLIVVGALILAGFFTWIRRRERAGKGALLSTDLLRNRTSNLGLIGLGATIMLRAAEPSPATGVPASTVEHPA